MGFRFEGKMCFFAFLFLCVVGLKAANGVISNVICKETSMTVEVERTSMPRRIKEDHLRLTDSASEACRIRSNKTHIFAVVPLNSCGTEIKEDDDNLLFTNEITTTDDDSPNTITRKHLMEVQFQCTYPKRGKVTQSFTAHRPTVTANVKGLGTFTYQFEFYRTRQFQNRFEPSLYPLQYELGTRIFMQIEATSSVINTMLFVETCKAAQFDSPNFSPSYTIIEDGCDEDSTVERHAITRKTQFRFSMEAFKFIGTHDQVYISCSVMMCDAADSNSRCAQGCRKPSRSRRHLGKREADTQTVRHLISQGPLRLKRSAEFTPRPVMNLNLNLVFVAGCLLAAVAMISAAVVHKAKLPGVKYQHLPMFERLTAA